MNYTRPFSKMRRRLSAQAGFTLAGILAVTPAHGQTTTLTSGQQMLRNDQRLSTALSLADIDGAPVASDHGEVTGSTVTVARNDIKAAIGGNDAGQSLETGGTSDAALGPAGLAATPASVDAKADMLVANAQRMAGSLAADAFDTPIAIAASDVTASSLALQSNDTTASAIANAASASLDLSGAASSASAGMVSTQSAAPLSNVAVTAARIFEDMTIGTGALTDSSVSLADNAIAGEALGNDATLTLSVQGAVLAPSATSGVTASMVGTADGSASSTAGFAMLGVQQATGLIKARTGNMTEDGQVAGPTFGISSSSATTSDIVANTNSLTAAATGNRAAAALDLTAAALEGDGPGAALTQVQHAGGAQIRADTLGGVGIDIGGAATDSRLSLADNSVAATAAANRAESRLDLETATGSGSARPASALVSADENAYADGQAVIQAAQSFDGSTIAASIAAAGEQISLGQGLSDGVATLTGNSTVASGVGNDTDNALTLTSAGTAPSAALANLQSGNGYVTIALGAPGLPAGERVTAGDTVTGSVLTIGDNVVAGYVTGNMATNALAAKGNPAPSADAIPMLGASHPALAGPTGDSYGAEGDLVIGNHQTLGEPDPSGVIRTAVSADVATRSGIDAPDTAQSTLAITGNNQGAQALGNMTANALDAGGTSGAALSSFQYGNALVAASSEAATVLPANAADANITITGNDNRALAVMNDATNILTGVGAQPATAASASASAAPLVAPLAQADAALANQQFAEGRVEADSGSSLGAAGSDGRIAGSMLTISDNREAAEAAGNRALNTLEAGSAITRASLALANSQSNLATVTASASAPNPATATEVTGSMIDMEGNGTTALARGNTAENSIDAGTAATVPGGIANDTVTGDVALASAQYNGAAIAASVTGLAAPLNGIVTNSVLTEKAAVKSATAYGNSATNSIAATSDVLGLASRQVNTGSVSAQISGGYRMATGALQASTVAITGNQLAATAVGNQASSAIAASR
ncbi:hypothetical protein [Sphingomonas sp.]|uniref:beta strand repeat-containing protein n=1 Tax=Sphingomonas sp. TaxID=28214 RepID=UPI0025F7B2FF|nr:hypothetical protein [Sphingomonas sp.]